MYVCIYIYIYTHTYGTPNLPTKSLPAKIRWLKSSGKFPTGLGIPPLKLKIMFESSPLKSRILVITEIGRKSQELEPETQVFFKKWWMM